jgi:hypothetical protein
MQEAYEAELARISTSDVIIQTAVTLINLAGRRLGLDPGSEGERDLEQVRDAIDAVRGMMGVLERIAPNDVNQLKAALSQLQMAYLAEAGAAPAPPGEPPAAKDEPAPPPTEDKPAEPEQQQPGPAQSSGRLWVPGS